MTSCRAGSKTVATTDSVSATKKVARKRKPIIREADVQTAILWRLAATPGVVVLEPARAEVSWARAMAAIDAEERGGRAVRAVVWTSNVAAARLGRSQRPRVIGMPGTPDISGVLRGGRALGIEVKRPGTGRVTQIQASYARAAQHLGALYCLATCVEDIAPVLDAIAAV